MENTKKYFAFISYKREDEKWAKWLQHKLEHDRLPVNVRKDNSVFHKTFVPFSKILFVISEKIVNLAADWRTIKRHPYFSFPKHKVSSSIRQESSKKMQNVWKSFENTLTLQQKEIRRNQVINPKNKKQ